MNYYYIHDLDNKYQLMAGHVGQNYVNKPSHVTCI